MSARVTLYRSRGMTIVRWKCGCPSIVRHANHHDREEVDAEVEKRVRRACPKCSTLPPVMLSCS